MIKKFKNYLILGDWSAETDDQVLIVNHPGKTTCDIFTMSGFDYGGGINNIGLNIEFTIVEDLINQYDGEPYELKEALEKICRDQKNEL